MYINVRNLALLGQWRKCQPWLSDQPHIQQVYPGENVDRFFSIIYFPCNLAILILCTIFMRVLKLKLRIVVGFSCILAAIMMPILVRADVSQTYSTSFHTLQGNYAVLHGSLDGNSLSLALLYVGAALAGAGDGFAQGAVFADASPLPPIYIQGVSVGTGMAGVLVVALRCITKASFSDDPVGLRNGAMIFYFLAVGIVFVSMALYLGVLHKLPIVRHYRSRVQYQDKVWDTSVCCCNCIIINLCTGRAQQQRQAVLGTVQSKLDILPGLGDHLHDHAVYLSGHAHVRHTSRSPGQLVLCPGTLLSFSQHRPSHKNTLKTILYHR